MSQKGILSTHRLLIAKNQIDPRLRDGKCVLHYSLGSENKLYV